MSACEYWIFYVIAKSHWIPYISNASILLNHILNILKNLRGTQFETHWPIDNTIEVFSFLF